MRKEILQRQIESLLISGFGIPEGMKEQWLELTGKEYKPNKFISILMKKI